MCRFLPLLDVSRSEDWTNIQQYNNETFYLIERVNKLEMYLEVKTYNFDKDTVWLDGGNRGEDGSVFTKKVDRKVMDTPKTTQVIRPDKETTVSTSWL